MPASTPVVSAALIQMGRKNSFRFFFFFDLTVKVKLLEALSAFSALAGGGVLLGQTFTYLLRSASFFLPSVPADF